MDISNRGAGRGRMKLCLGLIAVALGAALEVVAVGAFATGAIRWAIGSLVTGALLLATTWIVLRAPIRTVRVTPEECQSAYGELWLGVPARAQIRSVRGTPQSLGEALAGRAEPNAVGHDAMALAYAAARQLEAGYGVTARADGDHGLAHTAIDVICLPWCAGGIAFAVALPHTLAPPPWVFVIRPHDQH